MNSVYLKYLQFISLDELHQRKQEEISHTAIFLLNEIALKDFEKTPLTVMQAMNLKTLGSPSNLHHKLNELREAGMIEVTSVGTYRRTKYIFITQTAKEYFQIKSEAMLKAVK
jgi:DNA-binding transcriptional ArsR family regulator